MAEQKGCQYFEEQDAVSPEEKRCVLDVHQAATELLRKSAILCRPFFENLSLSSLSNAQRRYDLSRQHEILETRQTRLNIVHRVLDPGCVRLRESPSCREFSEMATEQLWRSFRRLFSGCPRPMQDSELDNHRSECSRSLVAFRICVRLAFGAGMAVACLEHDLE